MVLGSLQNTPGPQSRRKKKKKKKKKQGTEKGAGKDGSAKTPGSPKRSAKVATEVSDAVVKGPGSPKRSAKVAASPRLPSTAVIAISGVKGDVGS